VTLLVTSGALTIASLAVSAGLLDPGRPRAVPPWSEQVIVPTLAALLTFLLGRVVAGRRRGRALRHDGAVSGRRSW
jgi:hypothetical protein